MTKEILGIIPARGGSKRIPKKNIKLLCGKPLLYYTADSASKSKHLSRVILSSDDDEIIEYAHSIGLEIPFKRPGDLSEDTTPCLLVIQHAVSTLADRENYFPDVIVVLQPTSPLRTSSMIDEALEIFLYSGADSMVSVEEIPHNYSPFSAMQYDGKYIAPFYKHDEKLNIKQKKPVFYARNGALNSICTYQCLMEKNSLYGEKILPYFMSHDNSIDIDNEFDWLVVEYLLSKNIIK